MDNLTPMDIWALACVALFIKMFGIAVIQGHQRTKYKTFTKPEDAAFFGKTEAAEQERPIVDRGQRALRNDLENIPIFLCLGLAYAHLKCWSTGMLIYTGIFVASRYAHTLFYLKPTQPFRTISYGIGVLTMLAMCGHIVLAALA